MIRFNQDNIKRIYNKIISVLAKLLIASFMAMAVASIFFSLPRNEAISWGLATAAINLLMIIGLESSKLGIPDNPTDLKNKLLKEKMVFLLKNFSKKIIAIISEAFIFLLIGMATARVIFEWPKLESILCGLGMALIGLLLRVTK